MKVVLAVGALFENRPGWTLKIGCANGRVKSFFILYLGVFDGGRASQAVLRLRLTPPDGTSGQVCHPRTARRVIPHRSLPPLTPPIRRRFFLGWCVCGGQFLPKENRVETWWGAFEMIIAFWQK